MPILWMGGRRMKIQKIISLDKETAELAAAKSNFSGWVRNQLRSERNKTEAAIYEQNIRELEGHVQMSSRELLWHLEQRTDEEIRALVSLLKKI